MIRVFEKDGKINFVDSNDRFIGFDYERSWCEEFDWSVEKNPENLFSRIERHCLQPNKDKEVLKELVLGSDEPYIINHEELDQGSAVAFSLINPHKPKKRSHFLVLYNVHNGYYSHGFTWGQEKYI